MANSYEIDTLVRLAVAFATVSGSIPTDPTDIKLFVKPPTGGVTTYTYLLSQVIKDSTGMYHMDLLVNAIGVWTYKWQGTGSAQVTSPDQTLTCNSTIFVPPLP
jgi:hypothetical protein